MNRRIEALMLVFALTMMLCCAGLKEAEQDTQPAQPAQSTMQSQQASQERVAMKSSEGNFNKARESFLKKDYKASAKDIEKSITFMKSEAKRSSAAGKKLLTSSINELEKLAKDINRGRVTTVDTLDKVFTRARNALASNQQMKITESKTKTPTAKTGNALRNAPSNLKHGFLWTVDKIGGAASVVAKDSGFVVGKVIEGGGWVGKHTGDAINALSVKVENFGKNLQPKKQETMTQS